MAGILKIVLIWGLRGLSIKTGFFGHFIQNQSLKVSDFCMMIEGSGRHHLGMISYLGKILIQGLRGFKRKK